MQLITLPNGWEVRESPKMERPKHGSPEQFWYNELTQPITYPGIGPKPDYPDGELPEGVVRLQWQYWFEDTWIDCSEYGYDEKSLRRRIVAIKQQ